MILDMVLRRADGRPLGTFEQVQATLSRLCPGVDFGWTTSGPEKVRLADERGVQLPEAIRQWMETLPALLEGIYEGDGFLVEFGLGCQEPVESLHVAPHGDVPELERLLAALESEFGAELVLPGLEPGPAPPGGPPRQGDDLGEGDHR
jgi:hypothetical protein